MTATTQFKFAILRIALLSFLVGLWPMSSTIADDNAIAGNVENGGLLTHVSQHVELSCSISGKIHRGAGMNGKVVVNVFDAKTFGFPHVDFLFDLYRGC